MRTYNKKQQVQHFDAITIKLASPERIKEWSHGEITKPETINYRTQRSEKNGLFDEKIFGPDKDFECYCGKYRGIRYKGIICEKCGVEITRSIVRRERMGHIDLASPVSHIWFLRGMPSRIAMVLGMSASDVERVIYFAGYIITSVSEEERARILKDLDAEFKTKVASAADEKVKETLKERLLTAKRGIDDIQVGNVIDEVEYHTYSLRYGTLFEAGIGAEAVFNICRHLDLNKLVKDLTVTAEKAKSIDLDKINRRLSILKSMIKAGVRPEWMFLSRIPVIPPAIRPMVALDGGRYATSDVNDLYRRVINRNNRLKKLKEINAPDVILRNEKRILQEAVDALIDNTMRHGQGSAAAGTLAQRRALKSLADNLKGKRGLFRANLLGKRVDYSGRSVIVVGPNLKLSQCGLPKFMALELFKPFIISELIRKELAYNIRGATRLIDDGVPEVWAILEEVIKDKYVFLNRAPTLHRLGIQAFQPILIEGSAIQVHPLVCSAFNADFDGDQMAVHVPLSKEAQLEAHEIMAADKNILKPGSGDPTVTAKMLDIVLGVYWMTKIIPGEIGEGKIFSEPNEAIIAYNFNAVSPRALIKVLLPKSEKFGSLSGTIIETSVGRILFNDILPSQYQYVNAEFDRAKLAKLIDELVNRYGIALVPDTMDRIKTFGFKYATKSGVTWGIDDIKEPPAKNAIIDKAKIKAQEVLNQYNDGLLSDQEKYRKNIEIWQAARAEVEKLVAEGMDKNGSVYDMVKSGARGSMSQITNMAGMKGLISSAKGDVVEFPILSSSKQGLTPIEYFITTHGSRKGLTDTALNTAKAGYLTRRLFVVAQDVVITEAECGTKEGVYIRRPQLHGHEGIILKGIRGRVLASDVIGPDGTLLLKRGHVVTKDDAQTVDGAGVNEVYVRSPMTCKTEHGICQQCYGLDLGRNHLVDLGEAVGTVAAQAIGEPGTQLTMRTFHAGGTASVGGDITAGLPRVEEIFEKRSPKSPALISEVDGTVTDIQENGREKIIIILPEGKSDKKTKVEYEVLPNRTALVTVGSAVKRGDLLTDGSADIDDLFKFAGRDRAEEYIISEVSKPYELQGEAVSRKHIEVIIRQMFSRRLIKDAGETDFARGDVVNQFALLTENKRMKAEGKEEAKGEAAVMGITEISLWRQSFLSAASFQHTSRILINSAVRGSTDELRGLMENVIIGRLIPAGTGFEGSEKAQRIAHLQKTDSSYHTPVPQSVHITPAVE